MAKALQHCRQTGQLPPELKSHDQLNILDPVPVQQETCVVVVVTLRHRPPLS